MVNAYDTLSDGQQWTHTLQNEVGTALGAVDSVGFRPYRCARYIIYKEDSTYYRVDCNDGAVDDSSTNASTLINNALSDGTGIVFLRNGSYTIPSTITMGEGDILWGESKDDVVLSSTISDSTHVISANAGNDDSSALAQVEVRNLKISGGGSEGDGVYFEYVVRKPLVEDIHVTGVGGNGIRFHHCFGSKIIRPHCDNCGTAGVKVEDRSNSLDIYSPWLGNDSAYGLYSDNGGSSLTVFGGVIQENTTNDVYVNRVRGFTMIGTHLENSNSGVYMIKIGGDATYTTVGASLIDLYMNGASKAAHGIQIASSSRAALINIDFEGCDEPYNIDSNSAMIKISQPRFSSCNSGVNSGSTTDYDLVGYYSNSGASTGTGATQNIAHGLSVTPNRITFGQTSVGTGFPVQTSGANATYIFVSAGSGVTYDWHTWLA